MSNLYIVLFAKKYPTKGLTLVEVIVGMLISALFLSTVLQAYVSAVSIKAKAQQADVATTNIHSDIETIRQIAQEIPTDLKRDCVGNLLKKVIDNVHHTDGEKPNGQFESKEVNGVIEQSLTWPLVASSNEYQIRRILSTDDQSVANPSNLLHVFYEVTYRDSDAQIGDEAAQTNPETAQTKRVAQLRTSVMPNAVLVCP